MLMLVIQKCHKMGPATLSGINHCARLSDFDWSEYQSINNVYSYMTPHFNQLQVLCLTDFRSETDTVLNIPVLLKVNRSMHKSLNACSAVFRDYNRLVSEHKACILMPFQAAFVSDPTHLEPFLLLQHHYLHNMSLFCTQKWLLPHNSHPALTVLHECGLFIQLNWL